ncbi:MAG: PilZ domain-containing protein [Magnetococcus sp. YQC-3]
MEKDGQDRREDRLVSRDPAVMRLADGKEVPGRIDNMSLGGLLFVADDPAFLLERGVDVEIELTLYGRESRFPCQVAHRQENQFGLKLHRLA